MKLRFYLATCIVLICNTFLTYSAVERVPSDSSLSIANTWYYNYEHDSFHDETNNMYMICHANGIFNNLVAVKEYCQFLIGLKKYTDINEKFFAIQMLEYGHLSFVDYTGKFKISIKVNDEILNYPSVLKVDDKFIVIDESINSELYHLLLYLLTSQTPFKIKLEKYSALGIDYDNSYICEMPSTNFTEVYNTVYPHY